jgi:hypothetical protein
MTPTGPSRRPPLGAVLQRLRAILRGQAEALGAEDFAGLEQLDGERSRLVAALGQYGTSDTRPEDRELLEQIGALDQQLIGMAREGLERTNHELRDVHRGRGALTEYGRRGQTLIRNLAYLDQDQ